MGKEDDGSDWLAPRNLLYGTDVVGADGHSDYGNVFERFWHLYGYADLDPRSTVIITGDARNNYREPGADTLRSIKERAPPAVLAESRAARAVGHHGVDHDRI